MKIDYSFVLQKQTLFLKAGVLHCTMSLYTYFVNVYWHLWVKPDYHLIECLFLEVIAIITFIMSLTSIITIILFKRNQEKPFIWNINHFSVNLSISILSLSVILSLSGFLILIYQQNGRWFDRKDILCQIVSMLMICFIVLIPMTTYISIRSYLKWILMKNNKIGNDKDNIKWHEVKTLNKDYDMDLRYLVATKKRHKQESKQLLNEKTNKPLDDSSHETDIVLIANKTRYKLHLFSFVAQLILFTTLQIKNYKEYNDKLLKWGFEFSRLINEDDYYYAKWIKDNNLHHLIDEDETFETIEWLQYVARTKDQ